MNRSKTIITFALTLAQLWLAPVVLASALSEKTVSFQYQVTCNDKVPGAFPGISGSITTPQGVFRFDLFKYLTESEISIGSLPDNFEMSDLSVTVNPSNHCTLQDFKTELRTERSDTTLAFLHSPFLMVRTDQLYNRQMDVPLGITYSTSHPSPQITRIVYTAFFSNETVHGIGSSSKDSQLLKYGRRSDVEWIYQIDLDQNGLTLNESYQGGIAMGMGHKTHDFNGEYLPGTSHPILYNIATHNVFSDQPQKQQKRTLEGYLFSTRDEISNPDLRERWMWQHPWTFDVTDRELTRNHQLDHLSSDYLYILIDGRLTKGSIEVVDLSNPKATSSEQIAHLGQDLWNEQTMSALFWAPHYHGTLEIRPASIKKTKFQLLKALQFFRLTPDSETGYQPEDVTQTFHCVPTGETIQCKI